MSHRRSHGNDITSGQRNSPVTNKGPYVKPTNMVYATSLNSTTSSSTRAAVNGAICCCKFPALCFATCAFCLVGGVCLAVQTANKGVKTTLNAAATAIGNRPARPSILPQHQVTPQSQRTAALNSVVIGSSKSGKVAGKGRDKKYT